jgi:hypothetical protein
MADRNKVHQVISANSVMFDVRMPARVNLATLALTMPGRLSSGEVRIFASGTFRPRSKWTPQEGERPKPNGRISEVGRIINEQHYPGPNRDKLGIRRQGSSSRRLPPRISGRRLELYTM